MDDRRAQRAKAKEASIAFPKWDMVRTMQVRLVGAVSEKFSEGIRKSFLDFLCQGKTSVFLR